MLYIYCIGPKRKNTFISVNSEKKEKKKEHIL